MPERSDSGVSTSKNPTTAERTSERELVVKRTVNGPARLVFEAWTKPELFQRWWVPKSFGLTLLSCEMDVRVGGKYRLVFRHDGLLRHVPRSDATHPPCVDQRGRRRRDGHHGHLRREGRQDVVGRA